MAHQVTRPPEPSEPPKPGAVAIRQAFAYELKRVRRAAGEPSFGVLVERSRIADRSGKGARLSNGTLSRVLNGSVEASWPFTEAFLDALGMDPHTIQAVWLPRWIAMRDALDPLGEPLGGPPHGTTAPSLPNPASAAPVNGAPVPTPAHAAQVGCPACGLLVADAEQHLKWHREWQHVPAATAPDEHPDAAGESTVLRLLPGGTPTDRGPLRDVL
ncbi:helix-turn-helix domain-containing protein [Yinghuangia sp. YIM S09857]|uniref:helix-turn-helix domain-containing protein n=1 Tax=Yinghuangia sp. YIM S09857 TaxID=3436929 RepID=UPI003F53B26D